ncbi:IS66 family transposase, partial [Burkholderia pseudomallei]|nr:IS66 family transposase [Burkholderia pseudomallei]
SCIAPKPMLLERDARTGHQEDVVDSHKAANATAKDEIEHLKLLTANLRRMQIGGSPEQPDRQSDQLE